MIDESLATRIERFLNSRQAARLCKKYQTDPRAAWGEIYLRLQGRAKAKTIKNMDAWVVVNGLGVLRNYLRRECIIRP